MEPKTRAKFKCLEVAKREGWGSAPFVFSATLQPVTGGSPENEKFYAATPGGKIELGTVRGDHFEVGKTYYVDFTPAD